MSNSEEAFLQQLVSAFREEAAEHLAEIVNGLLKLEKEGTGKGQQETLEIVYRAAHSMKGAARAVNFQDIEVLCQSFENVLAAIKKGRLIPTSHHFDVLQQTVDLLQRLLTDPDEVGAQDIAEMKKTLAAGLDQAKEEAAAPGADGGPTPDSDKAVVAGQGDTNTTLAQENSDPEKETVKKQASPLERAPVGVVSQHKSKAASRQEDHLEPSAEKIGKAGMETVRIATSKLSLLFRQAEEMMAIKLYTRQRLEDIRKIVADQEVLVAQTAKIAAACQQAQRPTAPIHTSAGRKQDTILNGRVSEFVAWSLDQQRGMRSSVDALLKTVKSDERFFGRMVDDHLDDMKKALMLPCAHLLAVFPKMARDLARDQHKEIGFEMTGSEVEIDRRILEGVKDPLIHLVRNCIDHGIENPEQRQRAGKSPLAKVTIAVAPCDGNKVEIEVADDGGGIKRGQVVEAALKAGFIKADEIGTLSEQEELAYVFQSGVTTSPLITDISGRGLGLAIVRDKVEKIGGTISLTTKEGGGTSFKLMLPAMMATFRGVFVRVAGHIFAVPSIHVRQVLRMETDGVQTVENRETVAINGNAVSLVWLADTLELARMERTAQNKQLLLLDLCVGKSRMAFVVDEIIREDEGLVKGLGKQLVRVRNFSGVTVMGSGDLVPIIDVTDLLSSASRGAGHLVARSSVAEGGDVAERSVLVVEDSVTSRMLLKNVLESAGYKVVTAVDGLEGWTEVKTGDFSVVVSDIEMPRMNGFELTAKIRADHALCDIPIVLVTSLDAREDRERGVEAGASAYIVKSSFDQNNLLEVIRRLV